MQINCSATYANQLIVFECDKSTVCGLKGVELITNCRIGSNYVYGPILQDVINRLVVNFKLNS